MPERLHIELDNFEEKEKATDKTDDFNFGEKERTIEANLRVKQDEIENLKKKNKKGPRFKVEELEKR